MLQKQRPIRYGMLVLSLLLCPLVRGEDASAALRAQIEALRTQMEEQRAAFEAHIERLEARIEEIDGQTTADAAAAAPATDLAAALARRRAADIPPAPAPGRVPAALQSMNPDISVVIDTFYHYDNSHDGISHVFEEIAGFGHSHGHDHGHDHGELENGFNLRELELNLSAAVDPYFTSWVTLGFSEHDVEIEEAVIQTLSLPWRLQLKAGKFLSDFSRINAQHPHDWDFTDAPLVHELLFGPEGLSEVGLQLSWLAPTPFHLLFGVEALQGKNELVAQYHGDGPLSERSGPRMWVGWAKVSPNLPEQHGLQLGLSAGRAVHQEEHGTPTDHWLDGHTTFAGADIVYKYDAFREHGAGNLTLQSGYLWRRKDLELVRHDGRPDLVGNDRVDTQDGYYAQAVYGFMPRWRAGLRWEQVGLTNRSDRPDGSRRSYSSSNRMTGMVDFTPTEFSRLRLQASRGEYEVDHGSEDVWQFFVQLMISLGTHGAHQF